MFTIKLFSNKKVCFLFVKDLQKNLLQFMLFKEVTKH